MINSVGEELRNVVFLESVKMGAQTILWIFSECEKMLGLSFIFLVFCLVRCFNEMF